LIGAFGFVAQALLTNGLQREAAGRGTLALYTSVVFAVMFEFIIFHTTPPALSIAGTAIIMSSGIYITLTKRKAVVTKPITEPAP
jgi:drug/metabolite transporter (DMT)-like permease